MVNGGEQKPGVSHGGSGSRPPPWAPTRDRAGIASFCRSQVRLRICGGRSGGAGLFGGLVFGGGWLHRPGVGLWPDRRRPRFLSQPASVFRGNLPDAQNAHYYKLMGQPELGLKELELAHQQNPDNLQIVDLLAQNYEERENSRPPASFTRTGSPGTGPIPSWPIIYVSLITGRAVGKRRRRAFAKPWPVIPRMSRPATTWGSSIAVLAARTRPAGSGRKPKGPRPRRQGGPGPGGSGDA